MNNNTVTKKSLFQAILANKKILDDALGTIEEDVDAVEAICLGCVNSIRSYTERKETRLQLLRQLDADDQAPVREALVNLSSPSEELEKINDSMALLSRRIAPAGMGRLVPQFTTTIQAEAWWEGGES